MGAQFERNKLISYLLEDLKSSLSKKCENRGRTCDNYFEFGVDYSGHLIVLYKEQNWKPLRSYEVMCKSCQEIIRTYKLRISMELDKLAI